MRLISTPSASHPRARINSVDAAHGVALFTFLDAGDQPVDSGGSIARFAPATPLPDTEPPQYPAIDDATLAAAISNPVDPTPSDAEIYAAQLAPGYLDGVTGIRLRADERAQLRFTSGVALARLGIALNQIDNATPFAIWDYDNQEHPLTVGDFLALMFRYGLWCQQIYNDFAP